MNGSDRPGRDGPTQGAAAGHRSAALVSQVWPGPGGLRSALPGEALAGHIFTEQGETANLGRHQGSHRRHVLGCGTTPRGALRRPKQYLTYPYRRNS